MYTDGQIYMGLADGQRVNMPLNMSNRHGLIAGASGTGKTITMKAMAESFSDAGVPVFLCDVKGDVSGIATAGVASESMDRRIDKFGIRNSFSYKAYPVCFWDIYQEGGHPVRATISDMGPELLSRILGLTAAQEGVLNIVFRIADDKGLLLIDLKDLRILLNYVAEHKDDYLTTYGSISRQSVGGILRALLPLENQGGDLFFGEPDLDIYDWMRTDVYGKGIVNVLNCVKLVQNPTLYASFLLWMMSELFQKLPEAGDLEKPKLVFFFDEAHLLFADAPKILVQKIEQVGFQNRRNVDNEVYILQSHRLMSEVVKRLHLTVNYSVRDGLRTLDLYGRSPIEVDFIDDDNQRLSLEVTELEDGRTSTTSTSPSRRSAGSSAASTAIRSLHRWGRWSYTRRRSWTRPMWTGPSPSPRVRRWSRRTPTAPP